MNSLNKIKAGYPFYVADGMGVDSTAMLIKLRDMGVRPVEILFADTGAEKPETYAYIPVRNAWLKRNGFPALKIVRRHEQVKMRVPDKTLEDELIRLRRMPSLAFGLHSCSAKWKVEPQLKYLKRQMWTNYIWTVKGEQVIRCIGLDDSKADCGRTPRTLKYDDDKYLSCFPLQDLNITRDECEAIIIEEGEPLPPKSACYFCPAMKAHEIHNLEEEQLDTALFIEAQALDRLEEENEDKLKTARFNVVKAMSEEDLEDAKEQYHKAIKGSSTKGLARSKSWKRILQTA